MLVYVSVSLAESFCFRVIYNIVFTLVIFCSWRQILILEHISCEQAFIDVLKTDAGFRHENKPVLKSYPPQITIGCQTSVFLTFISQSMTCMICLLFDIPSHLRQIMVCQYILSSLNETLNDKSMNCVLVITFTVSTYLREAKLLPAYMHVCITKKTFWQYQGHN